MSQRCGEGVEDECRVALPVSTLSAARQCQAPCRRSRRAGRDRRRRARTACAQICALARAARDASDGVAGAFPRLVSPRTSRPADRRARSEARPARRPAPRTRGTPSAAVVHSAGAIAVEERCAPACCASSSRRAASPSAAPAACAIRPSSATIWCSTPRPSTRQLRRNVSTSSTSSRALGDDQADQPVVAEPVADPDGPDLVRARRAPAPAARLSSRRLVVKLNWFVRSVSCDGALEILGARAARTRRPVRGCR